MLSQTDFKPKPTPLRIDVKQLTMPKPVVAPILAQSTLKSGQSTNSLARHEIEDSGVKGEIIKPEPTDT